MSNKKYRILLPTVALKFLSYELVDQGTFKHYWKMLKSDGIKQRLDLPAVNRRISADLRSLSKYFNELIEVSPSKYIQEFGLQCKLNSLYDMNLKLKCRQECISLSIVSHRVVEQKAYEVLQNLAFVLV